MANGTTLDLTEQFNANGIVNIDTSGYDRAIVQLVAPAGAVTFNGSNDDGASSGIPTINGGPITAINFTTLFMTNLSTGVGATTGAVTGLWASSLLPRFLQLSGTTATKILVFLSKIY